MGRWRLAAAVLSASHQTDVAGRLLMRIADNGVDRANGGQNVEWDSSKNEDIFEEENDLD